MEEEPQPSLRTYRHVGKQRRVSSTAMFVTLLLIFKALRPHDTILPPSPCYGSLMERRTSGRTTTTTAVAVPP